jgi:hypothetical protein
MYPIVVRPSGVMRADEWRHDPHRLMHRSAEELREISKEILVVRTMLRYAALDALAALAVNA